MVFFDELIPPLKISLRTEMHVFCWVFYHLFCILENMIEGGPLPLYQPLQN